MTSCLCRVATLTRLGRVADDEIDSRPLDLGLIRRLYAYTRPYAARRNWLLALVILRSVQLPSLTWAIAAVIRGPIAARRSGRRRLGGGRLFAAGDRRRSSVCISARSWPWNWAKPWSTICAPTCSLTCSRCRSAFIKGRDWAASSAA